MSAGRPRKPTLVHELTGSARKNPDRMRLRENEPTDIPEIGDPPDYLTEFEKEAWVHICGMCADGVLAEF